MDALLAIRIAVMLIIAVIYMLFDVFNNRNVPSVFAYGTVVVGILFTLAYLDEGTIVESAIIASLVSAVGYVLYKVGQIGAADVLEFASISLMLPVMSFSYINAYPQLGIPFIVSVFIASGIIALLMIPFYYLPRASAVLKRRIITMVGQKELFKGLLILVAYGAFILFLVYYTNLNPLGLGILVVFGITSIGTTVFEKPLTDSMVEFIPPAKFEEGDIVALNVMDGKEIRAVKRKVKEFDRLMTVPLIKRMRGAWPKRKFPVYRSAMPLALPIFVGTVISILFGNLILFVLGNLITQTV